MVSPDDVQPAAILNDIQEETFTNGVMWMM